MLACIEDQCLMAWLPNMTQPPEVYFRVVVQPAQSVSVYVSSVAAFCWRNSHNKRGHLFRNLRNRLSAFHS